MGRKRKADAQEDKTNNGCPETTISKEITDNSKAMNVGNENNVKKDLKFMELAVRRSGRINSSGSLSANQKARPVVEQVNLVENEQEEVNMSPFMTEKDLGRGPQAQQASAPEMNERGFQEQVDYLIRTVNEFKSQFVRQAYARTNEGPSDLSYKSLYFESQKKIEALVEEHYDIVRKLEFARGKIEAYESMKDAMCAQKEVILIPSLAKATDPTANESLQSGLASTSPPPPSTSLPAATIPEASKDPKRKTDNRKKQVMFRLNAS